MIVNNSKHCNNRSSFWKTLKQTDFVWDFPRLFMSIYLIRKLLLITFYYFQRESAKRGDHAEVEYSLQVAKCLICLGRKMFYLEDAGLLLKLMFKFSSISTRSFNIEIIFDLHWINLEDWRSLRRLIQWTFREANKRKWRCKMKRKRWGLLGWIHRCRGLECTRSPGKWKEPTRSGTSWAA